MSNNDTDFVPVQLNAGLAPQGHDCMAAQGGSPAKSFNFYGSVLDEKSAYADKPKAAKPAVIGYRFFASYYVPVSFAAKDWNVTPRRIRALLAAGRLAGRLQPNGYWEVLFPYSFIFGTRGPSLKRQQRPPVKPKKPEQFRRLEIISTRPETSANTGLAA